MNKLNNKPLKHSDPVLLLNHAATKIHLMTFKFTLSTKHNKCKSTKNKINPAFHCVCVTQPSTHHGMVLSTSNVNKRLDLMLNPGKQNTRYREFETAMAEMPACIIVKKT